MSFSIFTQPNKSSKTPETVSSGFPAVWFFGGEGGISEDRVTTLINQSTNYYGMTNYKYLKTEFSKGKVDIWYKSKESIQQNSNTSDLLEEKRLLELEMANLISRQEWMKVEATQNKIAEIQNQLSSNNDYPKKYRVIIKQFRNVISVSTPPYTIVYLDSYQMESTDPQNDDFKFIAKGTGHITN